MSRSRSTIILGSGRILASGFSILTAMVLSRMLTRDAYGTYQQVWLVYLTILPFVMFGLPASVTYFVPQVDRPTQKAIVLQTGLFLMGAGLAVGLLTALVAGFLEMRFQAPGLAPLLRAFVAFPLLTFPLTFADSFLIATRKPMMAAVVTVASSAVQFGATILPILMGQDLYAVMIWLTVSAVVRLVFTAAILLWDYRDVPASFNPSLTKSQLQYSLPLGVSSILGTLTLQIDRILIALFFGAAFYGAYANAANELPFVSIITGSVLTVLTPEFVRLLKVGDNAEILRVWKASTSKVALVMFPLAAFFIAFAPSAIIVLFSSKYVDAIPISIIFLLILPVRITNYGALLNAAGRSRLVMMASLGTLVIKVVLGVVLVINFGLVGAAFSTLLAVYSAATWQLWECRKLLGVSWADIFPWRRLAVVALVTAIAALISALATMGMPHGLLKLGLGGALFVALLAPVLLLMKSTRADVLEIANAVPGVRIG